MQNPGMSPAESRVRRSADYPIGALRPLLRQGALIRLRRGAYARPREKGDLLGQVLDRCVAVSRQLRVRFAFSHETAVLLHGLPTFIRNSDIVHVIQESRPAATAASDLIRHIGSLPPSDITEARGLPVTSLDRTALDCARGQSPARSLAVVDAIMRLLAGTDRCTWPGTASLEAEIRARWLNRLDEVGRAPGVIRARAVVAHAEGRAESPSESQLRWRVLVAGFTAPELQIPVRTGAGTFYPDLLWSGASVKSTWKTIAMEYDGMQKYQDPQDLYEEKKREDALRSAGCLVVRATRSDLYRPGRMLRALAEHVHLDPEAVPQRRGLQGPPV